MASKSVQSKAIARPPPIVVPLPNIDLTVEEDMEDVTKEWDSVDGPLIHESKGELEPDLSQSHEKEDIHYLVKLPKDDLHKLCLALWRPEAHGHMRDSLLELVAQLESKHGCRLQQTRGCLQRLTSAPSSFPQLFEQQLSLTKPEAQRQSLPPQTSGSRKPR